MRSARELSHVPCSPTEHFVVFAMDARNRVIGFELVGKGGMSYCPVDPASVFRSLVIQGACGAIVVHNHPSGDTGPSAEDVAITARLSQAGKLLGIRILDHLIVGVDGYFSFLDSGLLASSEDR